ncbi:MAG: N-acetylmuramoyl-L-alanine amidase [Spirochaetes bacterium]|nr:N-acetylmuramoyl-L-alanine amidase [Spirochaetota bacterium]
MKKFIICILSLMFLSTLLYADLWKVDSFVHDGENFYPLYKIINILKISRSWDAYSGKFILRNDKNYVMFLVDEDKIYINRELKILRNAPVRKDGIVYIPEEMVRYLVTFPRGYSYDFVDSSLNIKTTKSILAQKEDQSDQDEYTNPVNNFKKNSLIGSSPDKIGVIIIDPGHGGEDPGAIGQLGLREKKVVLNVAKEVKRILENRLGNVKIILTRDKDKFIPLEKRAQMANQYVSKKTAGIFISIHANASYNKKTCGFETFVLSPVASDDEARAVAAMENGIIDSVGKNESSVGKIISQLLSNEYIRESMELAKLIQEGYGKNLPKNTPDRGIKKALFHVLEGTMMPAVLTEIGFITHRKEEKRMRKNIYQKKIASGIADGIVQFVKWYESNNGFIQ